MKLNKHNIFKIVIIVGLLSILASIIVNIYYLVQAPSNNVLYISLTFGIVMTLIMFLYSFFLYKSGTFETSKDISRNSAFITAISPDLLNGGVIIYNAEKKIIFITNWLLDKGFYKFLGKDISFLEKSFISENDIFKIQIKSDFFKIRSYEKTNSYFVQEITEVENLNKFIQKQQLCLVLIKMKFSTVTKIDDFKRVKAELLLHEFLEIFSAENKGLYRPSTPASEYETLFLYWDSVNGFFNKETDLFFKEITKIFGDLKKDISLSIGVAHGNLSLSDLQEGARKAIIVSENRGGDQIVIQSQSGEIETMGQSSLVLQEGSRVQIKFFYDHLVDKLRRTSNIFLTSHKLADLDALASCFAAAFLFRMKLNKNTFIILDDFDNSALEAKKWINKHYSSLFISQKTALSMMSSRSATIIMDVNEVDRCQAPEVVAKTSEEYKFIVDHHRARGKIEDFKQENIFLDTTMSSISEIITEFIKFYDLEITESTDKTYVSTMLLSGIYLDTNKLLRQTSPKTFDAVSLLVKLGANERKAMEFTQEKFAESKILVEAYENAKKITNNILLVSIPDSQILDSTLIPSIADKLLDYKDIECVFVLAKISSSEWKLSARSTSLINAQIICENLGGGGHFTTGAATFSKPKYSKGKVITNLVIEKINKYLKATTPSKQKKNKPTSIKPLSKEVKKKHIKPKKRK